MNTKMMVVSMFAFAALVGLGGCRTVDRSSDASGDTHGASVTVLEASTGGLGEAGVTVFFEPAPTKLYPFGATIVFPAQALTDASYDAGVMDIPELNGCSR